MKVQHKEMHVTFTFDSYLIWLHLPLCSSVKALAQMSLILRQNELVRILFGSVVFLGLIYRAGRFGPDNFVRIS